jgi:peroxiredoxin
MGISVKRVFYKSFIILCLFGVLSSCKIGGSSLEGGSKAPDFELSTLNGESRSLTSYRGKNIVLTFLSSWCGTCKEELPSLQELHEKVQSGEIQANIKIVAIGTFDDLESIRNLQKSFGLSFEILFDPTNQLVSKYRVKGVPEAFVINPEGSVLLFDDPLEGPLVKISGARDWKHPRMIERLKKL